MPNDVTGLENKVIKILADKLDIDSKNIQIDSKLAEDLGMDSFAAVEMAYELKVKFKVSFSQNDLPNLKTVKDIVNYISLHTH